MVSKHSIKEEDFSCEFNNIMSQLVAIADSLERLENGEGNCFAADVLYGHSLNVRSVKDDIGIICTTLYDN